MKRVAISKRRRESQGGYALLMIFLMAAIIALMLYQQLPRVAFESEREKEQLLIDRGEQYTRAIQLYYLANNRTYPTSLDDLEKQEKRFLRRRFVDPFTGKADWRIVHTNGGFLTDSLVQKPPADGQGQSAGNSTNGNTNSTSSTSGTSSAGNTNSTSSTNGTNEPPQVNAAVLQRPSDRPITPPGFGQSSFGQPVAQDPSAPQQVNTPLPPITLLPQQGPGQGQSALPPITLQPGSVNQPGGLPPITLAPIGQTGGQQMPGQIPGQTAPQIPGQVPGQVRNNQGTPIPGQPGSPGQPLQGQPVVGGLPGGIPGVPPGFIVDSNGQLIPATPPAGQNGIPGQAPGGPGQIPGVPGQTQGIPGQPFTPQPPTAAGPVQGSPSAALTAINQLLTSPRQTNTAPSTPTSGNQIGAIAGIASIHTGPSIKVYKDQQKYQLWEFVFSPTANTTPGAAAPGTSIPPNGQGTGAPGQPGTPSTFAPSGTFGPAGGQSPFGAGPAN
jgi:type II secretory pathway pseudopilin PulG